MNPNVLTIDKVSFCPRSTELFVNVSQINYLNVDSLRRITCMEFLFLQMSKLSQLIIYSIIYNIEATICSNKFLITIR